MAAPVPDQAVTFYEELFKALFTEPFVEAVDTRLKRNAIRRQVEEISDAASQSLSRFLVNQQLDPRRAERLLARLAGLADHLDLGELELRRVTPEEVVEALLDDVGPPRGVDATIHRIALHSVVQTLAFVGPVLAEWRKLSFASTFELHHRVTRRLNEITEQLETLGEHGVEAADYRFELSYRDYLMQRFYRVEAGTVRMTTNLAVDLRELFVMPRLALRPQSEESDGGSEAQAVELMTLAAARRTFEPRSEGQQASEEEGSAALDEVARSPRLIIVGTPGSGKSTFLEWLQLQVASVEEELVCADQQAIPVLLRVRELDCENLPCGAGLIERATGSRDLADLMPAGWMERKLEAGQVLLILDGLDEAAPELRDEHLIPWFKDLCERYPACRYVVSSRPVGYPAGNLRELKFAESDLIDFHEQQILEYTQHWCTSVRLAQNEPSEEARREGREDGERIVASFRENPYISDLARNPLMLSAICLVNYFEGGELPKDRALLYRLCVEGLLHNWDQRRGIHSDFGLEEKLRACREIAVAMQFDDRAEYEVDRVESILSKALKSKPRALKLLEQIRNRSGLIVERRAHVFAFAHLTFQEYLTARAVVEGNALDLSPEDLAEDHADGRWREVIPLYCGLAPARDTNRMLKRLLAEDSAKLRASVLADAFAIAPPEISEDEDLCLKTIRRIALAQPPDLTGARLHDLDQFQQKTVAEVANLSFFKTRHINQAHYWLLTNPEALDKQKLVEMLLQDDLPASGAGLGSLTFLAHAFGLPRDLKRIGQREGFYSIEITFRDPRQDVEESLEQSLAEVALYALPTRVRVSGRGFPDPLFLRVMKLLPAPRAYALGFLGDPDSYEAIAPRSKRARRQLVKEIERLKEGQDKWIVDELVGFQEYLAGTLKVS